MSVQKFILQTNYGLKEDFVTALANTFETKVDRLDFRTEDPENLAMNVNSWVASETKDRVKFILPTSKL